MWNVIKSISYQLAPKHISSRPLTIATNTEMFIKHVLVVFFTSRLSCWWKLIGFLTVNTSELPPTTQSDLNGFCNTHDHKGNPYTSSTHWNLPDSRGQSRTGLDYHTHDYEQSSTSRYSLSIPSILTNHHQLWKQNWNVKSLSQQIQYINV